MRVRTLSLILAASAGLAACGQTMGDQAIGGAAIGAAGNVAYCQANPGRCG